MGNEQRKNQMAVLYRLADAGRHAGKRSHEILFTIPYIQDAILAQCTIQIKNTVHYSYSTWLSTVLTQYECTYCFCVV